MRSHGARGLVLVALLVLLLPNPAAAQDDLGEALFAAAARGDAERTSALLQQGADAEWRDARGWTALLVACARSHGQVVRVLLAAGAKVDATSHEGATPLMAAAVAGDLETAKLLVEAGADLGRRNIAGDTARIKAEQYGRTEVAGYLRAREPGPLSSESSGDTSTPAIAAEAAGALPIDPMDAAYVLVADATFRSRPGADAPATGNLPKGTRVWITGKVRETHWYRVGPAENPSFVEGEQIEKLYSRTTGDLQLPDTEEPGLPAQPVATDPGLPAHDEPAEEDVRQLLGLPLRTEPSATSLRDDSASDLEGRWATAENPGGCSDEYLEIAASPEALSIFVYSAGERLALAEGVPITDRGNGWVEAGSSPTSWRFELRESRLHYSFGVGDPVVYVRCD